MNISTILNKAIRLFPEKEAVVEGEKCLTYAKLGQRVDRLASGWVNLGIQCQDRISVIAPNGLAFMEIYFAAAKLGLIINPINIRLTGSEIAYILNDAGSRILAAHTDFAASVKQALKETPQVEQIIWLGPKTNIDIARPSVAYEDFLEDNEAMVTWPDLVEDNAPAQIYYTSGTTGRPKGVVLTHLNVTTHALAAVAEFHLTDADTWFHVAPMFHLADAWATFALTWVGGRHVMLPYFDPAKTLSLIQKEHITLTNLIPTMLNLMVNHPQASRYDYSSLRVILSGGAPIAPETVKKIISTFGCDYIQTYGLTETSPYLTVSTLKAHLKELPVEKQLEFISRTGREFITVELRIVGDQGKDVPMDDRTVGEIWARGNTVTPGYWNLPEATADSFENGWFKTGDLAVINLEGYINIVDRKKDVIISGGENIYSTEVEYALYEHPAILECAVIGVPDDKWGEAVKAVVVSHPGKQASAEELISFVKKQIASFKAPKTVDFWDSLPKTGSGKIRKRSIKERYWSDQSKRVH